MSRNEGRFGKNKQNNAGKSYGIFGDAIGSLKQKLSFDGFEKDEDVRGSRSEGRFEGRGEFRENRSEGRGDFRREPRRNDVRQAPKPVIMPTNPRNFFVFDVETVPCLETARTFLKLGSEVNDDEVLAKLTAYHSEVSGGQNEFFRQLFHKVVCVSFVSGTIHTFKGGKEKYVIKNVKSEGRNGESEEEILRAVFSHLSRHSSRLVSFNGRGFDMPVLQYRAMKYGIDAKWIYSDGYYNYNHRYSIEKHCDLLEMFSNFGASARVKMAEVCALFKVPCKVNGIDGSSVLGLFKEGKFSQIADYCENDVIATYILYLRFMQHSGKLSAEGYNICLDNLCAMLKADDANPSHALFVEQLMQMNGGNAHIALPQGAVKQEEENEEQVDEASQEEISHDEGSQDENLQDEGSQDEISQEGSQEEISQEGSSQDENLQDEGSQDEEENQGR